MGSAVFAFALVSALAAATGGAARADGPVPAVILAVSPDHGPVVGGQTVTLEGGGFVTDATTVDVGALNVWATVLSPTRLTFVTPAHPSGAVPLRVEVDELPGVATLYYFDGSSTVPAGTGVQQSPTPTPTPGATWWGDVRTDDPPPSGPAHPHPGRPATGRLTPVRAAPPQLAATGFPVGAAASLAAAMIAIGTGAVVLGGRRRPFAVTRRTR